MAGTVLVKTDLLTSLFPMPIQEHEKVSPNRRVGHLLLICSILHTVLLDGLPLSRGSLFSAWLYNLYKVVRPRLHATCQDYMPLAFTIFGLDWEVSFTGLIFQHASEVFLNCFFLTFQDLNAYKKQGMALLSKMGESVKYVTGGYKLRSRPLEFAAIGEYLDTFSLKLGTIDRIAQRIIKEQLGKEIRSSVVILQSECSLSYSD